MHTKLASNKGRRQHCLYIQTVPTPAHPSPPCSPVSSKSTPTTPPSTPSTPSVLTPSDIPLPPYLDPVVLPELQPLPSPGARCPYIFESPHGPPLSPPGIPWRPRSPKHSWPPRRSDPWLPRSLPSTPTSPQGQGWNNAFHLGSNGNDNAERDSSGSAYDSEPSSPCSIGEDVPFEVAVAAELGWEDQLRCYATATTTTCTAADRQLSITIPEPYYYLPSGLLSPLRMDTTSPTASSPSTPHEYAWPPSTGYRSKHCPEALSNVVPPALWTPYPSSVASTWTGLSWTLGLGFHPVSALHYDERSPLASSTAVPSPMRFPVTLGPICPSGDSPIPISPPESALCFEGGQPHPWLCSGRRQSSIVCMRTVTRSQIKKDAKDHEDLDHDLASEADSTASIEAVYLSSPSATSFLDSDESETGETSEEDRRNERHEIAVMLAMRSLREEGDAANYSIGSNLKWLRALAALTDSDQLPPPPPPTSVSHYESDVLSTDGDRMKQSSIVCMWVRATSYNEYGVVADCLHRMKCSCIDCCNNQRRREAGNDTSTWMERNAHWRYPSSSTITPSIPQPSMNTLLNNAFNEYDAVYGTLNGVPREPPPPPPPVEEKPAFSFSELLRELDAMTKPGGTKSGSENR